jgi:L-ribulose-5-phosphate 3-epimerase UlaE
MANSAAAGYDPVADLRHAEGRLVAMHVKDGLPRVIRRVPFGTGIVHFDPVFRTLAEMNFHGPFIVEMWCDDAGEAEAVETARAARSFVADLVARTYPATALAVAG